MIKIISNNYINQVIKDFKILLISYGSLIELYIRLPNTKYIYYNIESLIKVFYQIEKSLLLSLKLV